MRIDYILKPYILSCLLIVLHSVQVTSLEPITTGLAVGTAFFASAVLSNYNVLKSLVFESCDDNWIDPRLDDLHSTLETQLHGQHLVVGPVMRALRAHLRNDNPAKALVLSFHGWTGNGKNFVSNIIGDHLYKKGRTSNFVHLFVATHHFPHAHRLQTYQDQLRDWIKGNTTSCGRSLFIFDEVDKQPEGLMDTIKPFLDHYPQLDGVNFRKNIFIFLSNAGGNEITGLVYDNWMAGRLREQLKLSDMEEAIHGAAFNEEGGLKRCSVIDKNLVSVFVPFLPMERKHVISCIKDDLRKKKLHMSSGDIQKVADELRYDPPDTKVFSKTGCKRVPDKVDLIAEEINFPMPLDDKH